MQESTRITIKYKLFIEKKLGSYQQLFNALRPMPPERWDEVRKLEKILMQDFQHPIELYDSLVNFRQKIIKPTIVKYLGFLDKSRLTKVIDEILNDPLYSRKRLKIAYLYELDEMGRNSWENHPEAKQLHEENHNLKLRLTTLEKELVQEQHKTQRLIKQMQEKENIINELRTTSQPIAIPHPVEITAYQQKITELELQLSSSELQITNLKDDLANSQRTHQKLHDSNFLLAKRNNELVSENRMLKQELQDVQKGNKNDKQKNLAMRN